MIRHQLPALGSPAWLDMDHRDIIRDGEAATPPERSVQRVVSLRLTEQEARALSLVVGNGWGDGDFAEWLGSRKQVSACKRAMEKLENAIRNQANDRTDRPESERNK